MTSDRRRSELEGSQLCAASFYLVIIMTSNLLNLTHTTCSRPSRQVYG
jgi:hypothetical protein